jgi:hypothetical protein
MCGIISLVGGYHRDMKIMNNSTFSLSLASSEPKSNDFLKLAEPLLLAASS